MDKTALLEKIPSSERENPIGYEMAKPTWQRRYPFDIDSQSKYIKMRSQNCGKYHN
tara:strand:+ start:2356 stop:2523 length:168 start_codon:yes stop_codon:yes gene_type:complete